MINENTNTVWTNNLKRNSVNRILIDMIGDVKRQAGPAFVIIIVDDYTATILSSFLTMSEVLNEGIFSIERLGTKRQKFPKYHALYFISPTSESCGILAKEFDDESSPQYSRAHIFFSHRIMDVTLENMVTQSLVRRVKTCKELNLSFLVQDKNLFDLGLPGALKVFTVKNNAEARNRILSNVMERLMTVCTVLKEFPYIQYQKNSSLCLYLAENLNAQLNEFYKLKNYNEKRGILLICDRTIDITTPLLHDYNYEPMIYDLFKTKDNELQFNEKTYMLDEKDDLWAKYKNKHMCAVFEELQKDFGDFMQSDLSKVNKAENLDSFDEMADVLHHMKGYKTKTAQFGLHLKLAEEITTRYKQQYLYDIIELEQDIVTGINQKGDSVSNKEIFDKYANIRKNPINPKDNLRIITTLHSCLDITEKDFSVLAGNFSNEDKKPIYNLEWLGISFAKSKSKNARRESTMKKKDIKEFKMKSKSLEYNFLRSSPKLEGIVESCSKYVLSRTEFPFVEEPKNLPTSKAKNYNIGNNPFGGDGEDDEQPNLIVFVLGGIAHNEICALEKLNSEKKVNHHLVMGSTSILTAEEYLKQLRDLSAPNDPSASIDGPRNVEMSDIELTVRK